MTVLATEPADCWWTISGRDLLAILHAVAEGADPDQVYGALYAESEKEVVK